MTPDIVPQTQNQQAGGNIFSQNAISLEDLTQSGQTSNLASSMNRLGHSTDTLNFDASLRIPEHSDDYSDLSDKITKLTKKIKKIERNKFVEFHNSIDDMAKQIRDEINSRFALSSRSQQQAGLELKNAFQDIEQIQTKMNEQKKILSDRIGDIEQQLGTEIDKIKITQNLQKEFKKLELEEGQSQPVAFNQIPISLKDDKAGAEAFTLRNTIFQVERKLKSEIQQRTGILARAQQTELFNIREVLRSDRKQLGKVSENVENLHRELEQEIKQVRSDIIRKDKGLQERIEKQSTQTVSMASEIDHRIQHGKKLTDQAHSELREDWTNDRIELKSKMKEIFEVQRQRKTAFDRLVSRQIKVEKSVEKICKETKDTIKYFTQQIEDSE